MRQRLFRTTVPMFYRVGVSVATEEVRRALDCLDGDATGDGRVPAFFTCWSRRRRCETLYLRLRNAYVGPSNNKAQPGGLG